MVSIMKSRKLCRLVELTRIQINLFKMLELVLYIGKNNMAKGKTAGDSNFPFPEMFSKSFLNPGRGNSGWCDRLIVSIKLDLSLKYVKT